MEGTAATRARVLSILTHAEDLPWRMVDIGLMGLRLDERHEERLHVWGPGPATGDPPIHDHPYDFQSTVVVGELTNTRYAPSAAGEQYLRLRYSPPDEDRRRRDAVTLVATPERLRGGDRYRQLAPELHSSRQEPGTVTLLRCSWHEPRELTVCLRDEADWCSGRARPATRAEIAAFTAEALARF